MTSAPAASRLRTWAWGRLERLLAASVRAAARDQGLDVLARQLAEIVPDISAQYTGIAVVGYLETKVRVQQAFQVAMVRAGLAALGLTDAPGLTVLDIGDSSGTHLAYLRALHPGWRGVGVNLDPVAIEKIRARGFEAMHCRAEEVDRHTDRADVLMSFQMLEHLVDPIGFLRQLARNVRCRCLVVTVPYVARSRVNLEYIRLGARFRDAVTAESTHVFELAPPDWRRIFAFSGWSLVDDEIYRQYPRVLGAALAPIWRRVDFEGFYGAILVPDDTWSRRYPW